MANSLITLTSIQKLVICIEASSQMDKLFASLSQLPNFRSLILTADRFPSLTGIGKLTHLSELKLVGKLNVLPPLPPNLSHLKLYSTKLKDDPMPILARLGQLSFLKLIKNVHPRKKMTIPRDGFYQLNFLELKRIRHLEVLTIEKGALQELKCLRIRSCEYLRMIPEELTSMTSLQKLELVNMSEEFVNGVLEGPDSDKVRGVPTLKIFNA